jgi:hypothetical protein
MVLEILLKIERCCDASVVVVERCSSNVGAHGIQCGTEISRKVGMDAIR